MVDPEVDRICKDEGKQKIAVWPDGTWCWPDGIESMMMSGKSDDYAIILVPIEYGPVAIEKTVEEWLEEYSWPGDFKNFKG